MKLRIGITGGIGSGKTTVSRVFEALGFPVYYADLEAKKIIETDAQVINKISNLFGSDIYLSGKLDRKRLASLVFNDNDLLNKINGIVHPAVAIHFENWVSKSTSAIVFKEAAILFESGAYKQVDKTILVTAPLDLRVKRVTERDGVLAEDVKKRIANQMSENELLKLTNFTVVNDGNTLVLPQLLSIIENLKKL